MSFTLRTSDDGVELSGREGKVTLTWPEVSDLAGKLTGAAIANALGSGARKALQDMNHVVVDAKAADA